MLAVVDANVWVSAFLTPGDAPFIALARAFGCPVVTGNARHFPPGAGVEVLTPGQCLERLAGHLT